MKKNIIKRDQIFPPYLVPYKDAMYQDHFDLNYIREELRKERKRLRMIEQSRIASEDGQLNSIHYTSVTKEAHKSAKYKNIPTDVNQIDKEEVDEQSFYAAEDNWFDDW